MAAMLALAGGIAGADQVVATAAAADAVERTSWRGEVHEASRLEVLNPFGDIRLRYGGEGRTVEVTAVLQQLDPAGSRLELEADVTEGSALVRVVRRGGPETPSPDLQADPSRADIVVLVPAGLAVAARGDRGFLESTGLDSDVELETVSGAIRVRFTRGRVLAHSERGGISAVLLPGVTTAPQRVSTATGSIEVWVSDVCSLEVTMATSARVTSDYSMQVKHHDQEEPDKVATAVVGGGGSLLEVLSRRGDVALRRLVQPEQLAVRPAPGGAAP